MSQALGRLVWVVLLAGLVLASAGVALTTAGEEAGAGEYAVATLRRSIVQALGETPSAWKAAVRPGPEAAAWTELGEVSLERYAAGHTIMAHLPRGERAGGLPFTTMLCEEQPHVRGLDGPSEGTCFFYTTTDRNSNNTFAGEELEVETEVFLKYEVPAKRPGSRGLHQRRLALAAKKGMKSSELSNDNNSSFVFPPSKAGVYIIEEAPLDSMDEGNPPNRMLGYVFIEEHVDVVDGFSCFSLLFYFSEEMHDATTARGRRWPAAFKLTGMIGDIGLRAARQRTAQTSTLFYRWLFPVLLLAGLIGILWLSIKAVEWKHRASNTVPTNGVLGSESAVNDKKRN